MSDGGAVIWREIVGGYSAWDDRLRVIQLGRPARWCIVADGNICRGAYARRETVLRAAAFRVVEAVWDEARGAITWRLRANFRGGSFPATRPGVYRG